MGSPIRTSKIGGHRASNYVLVTIMYSYSPSFLDNAVNKGKSWMALRQLASSRAMMRNVIVEEGKDGR